MSFSTFVDHHHHHHILPTMAEYREAKTYDIAPRLKSNPKPHVDNSTYERDHAASIKDSDAFFGKVGGASAGKFDYLFID